MTTITATFRGKPDELKDASVCAIHYASTRRLTGDLLTVSYICETDDYEKAFSDVMDSIDIARVELCNCELVSIA